MPNDQHASTAGAADNAGLAVVMLDVPGYALTGAGQPKQIAQRGFWGYLSALEQTADFHAA
jgi:hypothetical protein